MVTIGEPMSVDAIRAELIELRRTVGLTYGAVKKHAQHVQALPAVNDEMARRNLDVDSRHVAAYSVIRCGIDYLVADYRHQTFLKHTLNIADGRSPSHDDFRPTVKQRKVNALHDLGMSEYSEAYVDSLVADAYTELASGLVGASPSPCQIGQDSEQLAARIEATVESLSHALASQVELLAALGKKLDPDVRRELGRKLAPFFVNGIRKQFEDQDGIPDIVAVEVLIEAVIHYEASRFLYQHTNDRLPPLDLVELLVGVEAGSDEVSILVAQNFQQLVGIDELYEGQIADAFYEAKFRSLLWLEWSIVRQDMRGWPAVRGPGKTADAEQ